MTSLQHSIKHEREKMKPIRASMLLALVIAGSTSSATLGAGELDSKMKQLAATSGCFTCHSIEPRKPDPDGTRPIGPSWQEVSAKYKGQVGAGAQLTNTVMQGSNPYNSHWQGKVSGLAMPPNAVAIKEADAKLL